MSAGIGLFVICILFLLEVSEKQTQRAGMNNPYACTVALNSERFSAEGVTWLTELDCRHSIAAYSLFNGGSNDNRRIGNSHQNISLSCARDEFAFRRAFWWRNRL
jgi:hypothetical protein